MPQKSRAQLIAAAWASRLVLGGVAAALVLLLGPSVVTFLRLVTPIDAPWWWLGLALIPLAPILFQLANGRWLAFLGITHLFAYPPLWISSLLGLTCAALAIARSTGVARTFGIGPVGQTFLRDHIGSILLLDGAAIATAAALSILLRWTPLRRSSEVPKVIYNNPAAILSDIDRLMTWLSTDEPISDRKSDAFGHVKIAARIAARLTTQPAPTMVVFGDLGSGKTSVLQLVREQLKQQHLRIVQLSLAPFETVDSAISKILDALTGALHAEVGVPTLRGLPAEYVEAISDGESQWTQPLKVLGRKKSPPEVLSKLDELSTTLGVQLLLWLEDIERFADGVSSSTELRPLKALLHLLDASQSVSFVVAACALDPIIDLPKLARYIETIPPIPLGPAAALLSAYRGTQLDKLKREHKIEPATRRLLDDAAANTAIPLSELLAYEVPVGYRGGLISSMGTLCPSPRQLKFALRRCSEIWDKLRGEVDFDDILMMSLIREGEPRVFAFVERHIATISDVGMTLTKAADQELPLEQAFEQVEIRGPSRQILRGLLYLIFPRDERERKPQGLCRTSPRRYWNRFLSEDVDEHERDQPILQVCHGDDDPAIVRHLVGSPTAEATEHFLATLSRVRLGKLTAKRLVNLLRLSIAIYIIEPGKSWPDRTPPAIEALWRLLLIRKSLGDRAEAEMEECLRNFFLDSSRLNVQLLERVEHLFLFGEQGPDLISREGRLELIKLVTTSLDAQTGNPQQLASALGGGDPWAIKRLVNRRADSDIKRLPWPTWPIFAKALLDAATDRPADVLPSVAALVTEQQDEHGPYLYDPACADILFDRGQLEQLVGANVHLGDISRPLAGLISSLYSQGREE